MSDDSASRTTDRCKEVRIAGDKSSSHHSQLYESSNTHIRRSGDRREDETVSGSVERRDIIGAGRTPHPAAFIAAVSDDMFARVRWLYGCGAA